MPQAPPIAETRAFLKRLENRARAEEELAGVDSYLGGGSHSAYRWGRLDRRTQGYQPYARSADSAIVESQELMHRRTRSECINNAQIKRIEQALCDLIVGPGMLTFADPFDPLMDIAALMGEDLDGALGYALEADELFDEWWNDPEQFSADGKTAGPDVQRMALLENVRVGDTLLLRVNRDEPLRGGKQRIVPLCYQTIEREQLDTSHDRPSGPSQNKIVNGIEVDAWGREVAFYIFDEHPYDDFAGATAIGKSRRVPADRVTHLCLFERPSQNIGASWLGAIGQNNFDRDRFIGSELQTAAKAAALLLVWKLKNLKANLGLDDGTDDTDDFGNQQLKLGSSPQAFKIGPDDDMKVIETNRPTSTLDPFITILDHDTAAGVGLSYYTMSGRMDKSNYTAIRGALLAEDAHIRPLQNWFARQIALPQRREFQRQAIALGRLKSVSAAKYATDPRRFSRFDAVGAGRDLLDPEAENNAALGKLRGGLTTLKQECARRGLHWIKVLRQKALENRLAELLGVVLDFSKGQGGQVDGTTSSSGGATGTNKRDTQQLLQTLGGAA